MRAELPLGDPRVKGTTRKEIDDAKGDACVGSREA
jgi:hypothetical protein